MSEPTEIFDRALLQKRRGRAAREVRGQDFLLRHAVKDIAERIGVVNRSFSAALLLGCHGGEYSQLIAGLANVSALYSTDACPAMLSDVKGCRLVMDEEALAFAPESFDLIVSQLTLQWVNDLPGSLVQIRRCLKPDGLFIAVLLGGESLSELRNAVFEAEEACYGGTTPRVAPFADVRDYGNLLQRAGFALPVADREVLNVSYGSALDLMRDLKSMGASNVLHSRSRLPVSRRFLSRVDEVYKARYLNDQGRIDATFELIYLIGWAPHESQQKPLSPGSADVSFSDIFER